MALAQRLQCLIGFLFPVMAPITPSVKCKVHSAQFLALGSLFFSIAARLILIGSSSILP